MPQLGTRAWAKQTGGKLSLTEQLRLVDDVVRLQIEDQINCRFRNPRRLFHRIDLDAITIPDSDIAQKALDLCQNVSPTSLLNHTQRTYFWASLLAQIAEVKLDSEFLYVASTLHDLGLTDTYNHPSPEFQCFAVEGGQAAGSFANKNGWSETQAHKLNEAICLHLNMIIPPAEAEAKYMAMGTTFDVIGLRYEQVPPEAIERVLVDLPRMSFKAELIELLNREYKNRPQSRITFLQKIGQLNKRIRQAPFAEG